MSIIEGLLLGLGTIIFIGPVFFIILQNTLAHGKTSGFCIALGILFSDISYVLLFKFSLYEKISTYTLSKYFYWIFAMVIMFVGISSLFKKNKNDKKLFGKNYFILFSKGFLVNFINPFVFVFWLGVYTYVQQKFTSPQEEFYFFTAAMFGILSIDTLRVLFSNYLKTKLTDEVLTKTNKAIGVLLIIISCYLLLQY